VDAGVVNVGDVGRGQACGERASRAWRERGEAIESGGWK
jgi:hypothetical protein